MTTSLLPLDSTRNRLIAQARTLFAERGFYGVSIAQIAAELGMSKQALLHHFGTKEKLYGQVLADIAREYAELRNSLACESDPTQRFAAYMVAMVADTPKQIERTRLLMRELLDNPARAERTDTWYLKPLLEDLGTMLRSVPGWAQASDTQLLTVLIQLLGAISYHAVAGPTFRGIFGDVANKAMQAYGPGLHSTVTSVLHAGPSLTAEKRKRGAA